MTNEFRLPELPHGESLRFIERVLAFDGEKLCCAVRDPLPEAVGEAPFGSWWALEIGAQASGILLSLKDGSGAVAAEGRLVQARNLVLHRPRLPEGEPLEVETELESAASLGSNLFQCRVRTRETQEILLEATINLLVLPSSRGA